MQAFFRVMADRCGKVLKVTTGTTVRPAPFGIGSTFRAGDFAQILLTEELKESPAALGAFIGTSLARRHVGEIDINDVGYWNLIYAAFAARRLILASDVSRERRFSRSTVANAEASAVLVSSVSDNPDGGVATIAWRSEP